MRAPGGGSPGLPGAAGDGGDRERRTVRRALVAGGATWLGLGLLLGLRLAPGGGEARLVGVLLAMIVAGLVASGWLLLALLLDLVTDQPIGRGRLAWTAALVVFTIASPMLLLGAGG